MHLQEKITPLYTQLRNGQLEDLSSEASKVLFEHFGEDSYLSVKELLLCFEFGILHRFRQELRRRIPFINDVLDEIIKKDLGWILHDHHTEVIYRLMNGRRNSFPDDESK